MDQNIDDIFVIMNKRKVVSTLNWLNSLEDTINFTKEEEQNNKLPFLDVMVINEITLNWNSTSIGNQHLLEDS